MSTIAELDKIAINVKSHKLLRQLIDENPELEIIMRESKNETEALIGVRNMAMRELRNSPNALAYYEREKSGRNALNKLKWKDIASIRLLDYVNNANAEYEDLNLHGEVAVSNPIKLLWLAVARGTGGAKPYFFDDMIQLFRQFSGHQKKQIYKRETILNWMNRWPVGTDPRIKRLREENRNRIINIIIQKIDTGEITDKKYFFKDEKSHEEKFLSMLEWWNEKTFHLRFAVRTPELLNEFLDFSLDPDTMKLLKRAKDKGIPFFVNPYYLSLLHVRVPYFAIGADLAIRHYILYSEQLVEEFGQIQAWEKEDIVEPGKPNAAGWILPSHHSVHRRYPEVAILIPDTVGRACGGLCSSCQRMYDFQRGNLNFNLDKLNPNETWPERLKRFMKYWEDDTQLRDILITGGDALMSSNKSLKQILDAVLETAKKKKAANSKRKEGEKYAEILRVRLGTRLPIYLPQRIGNELISILKDFKKEAKKVGIQQFVIQTHFESPMEITPESVVGIQGLISAGWMVTNQLVFTASASRRGHSARLRQALNDIGVMNYYTFSVKGYMENSFNFATNARAVQEQVEEKTLGEIPEYLYEDIKKIPNNAENICQMINDIRNEAGLPFLGTDRTVLNLPGVGKSLTYRVIGITRYGRRILAFEHDATRRHSPAIHDMEKVIIIESKSISEYLQQLEEMGENLEDYQSIYGYSIGETENRVPIYDYPEYDYESTEEMTNLGEI
ncbi:MAG: KamA family protein [Bacteroidota bacterium]|nr:KamA family protein [Bacteroidota bacterium]